MTYRLHPKRGLYLDSPKANAGRLGGRAAGLLNGQGQNSRFRGPRVTGSSTGSRLDEAGFTLIEVIAGLIIVAVLAAMIFPVTSGQWRSARGVGECRELFELQGQMERIVADYKNDLSDDGDVDLENFRTTVINNYSSVDSDNTRFLMESGSNLTLTASPTSLLLVTLTAGDQRIANVFAGD